MDEEDFDNAVPIFEDINHEEEEYRAEGGDPLFDEIFENFNPEPPIRHDVYPESDSDGELVVTDKAMQLSNRSEGNLFVGQIFCSKETFSEAVLDHALKEGRNIKRSRHDKTKIAFSCIGGNCDWKVYCARISHSDDWEVRKFADRHSCVPNGDCKVMKVPVIAMLFREKLKEDPEFYMPAKIEELVMEKWKIKVSRGQCQVARLNALKSLEHEYDEQFQRLRDYAAEIRLSNPNSTVDVETQRNEQGLDLFDRFYICIDVLRKTWKASCRQIIGVDGCFLKGKMKGQLLVAIGRDGDNSIYPIAWGVVQAETTPNWLWFLRKLKTDFELGNGECYVLVSDRQKGLINAAKLELPNMEHRMCVRHIYTNLKAKHGKKAEMKRLLWNLAWSYNDDQYKKNLGRIMIYDEGVYTDIIKAEPKKWCRAFYKIGSQCEDVENNFTESFNATVVKARKRQLVPMLELIARQAMVRISKRSAISHDHQGRCTPYVEGELAKEYAKVAACRVYTSTNNMYQVLTDGGSFMVSLGGWSCTCRKWEITGIPCEHSYAVILHKKLEVEDYVFHWFKTDMWRRTYTDGIMPNRGPGFWPVGTGSPVHMPPSPPQTGRPKKSRSKSKEKRKKGVNESPTKKAGLKKRVMHCGVCGAANHNSRYHSRKGTESSQVVPSQPDASEFEPS